MEDIESNLKFSRIFKYLLSIVAILVFILTPFIYTPQIKAATLSDLQKKQQELNNKITQDKKLAEQKKKDAEELQKNLGKINSDIRQIQDKINDTNTKINQTQEEITKTSDQINQKQKEIDEQKSAQAESIRIIYKNSQTADWEIFLGSNNLSEMVNYNEYMEAIEQKIESTIKLIQGLKTELESKRTQLEKEKQELAELKNQQDSYNQGLEIQKGQKNKLLKDTKSQQKDLEAQIAESKKMSTQVEAEISKMMSVSKGSKIIARDKGTSSVGFQWPMDYNYISAYWGESTPFQSFHSGVDLVNVMGSPIYATASGTVTTIASMQTSNGHYYGYGNYIIIGHNARFSSLYGHLMGFAVSPGDEVKLGQIIGYEGSTGWSTGPHLHFEIWEYGARQNPLNYLP